MDKPSENSHYAPLRSTESIADDKRVVNNARREPCIHQYNEYDEGTKEEMWRFVRRDSSFSIPEIGVSEFIDHLLPPLKSGINVEDVLASLRDEDLITSNDRWSHFETQPVRRAERKDVVFAPLAELCRRSTYHASKTAGLEPTFILSLLSGSTPTSHSASSTRPDGYFILKEAEDRAQNATDNRDKVRWWYDIALTAKFKKRRRVKDIEDNISKLIFNMQQTMALDPCRRFTFGITIENKNMRLWFCSRATAVVSNAFDFTKEVNLLTRVFLSFTFASKEEFGWDPSIRSCIGRDGTRQYQIEVDKQTYETEEMLSDFAGDALLSRATRVWKVKLLDSDEPLVLKDVWVEDDRLLEHIIYDLMLHDVEQKYGPNVQEEAASHLLTPVAHWLVSVNGEEDHTTRVMMRGYSPTLKHKFKINVKEPKNISVAVSSGFIVANIMDDQSRRRELRAPFPRNFRRRRTVRRRHYRIVFKEVADTLYTVRDLGNVFLVLRDSAKVLEWIHGCGWVHRDISAGNLYLFDGRGLLGDLEYAKVRNSDATYEVQIGTSDFMATEVLSRTYNYVKDVTEDDIAAKILALKSKNFAKAPSRHGEKASPPFFHNDLHDLESLWWVAIWELFFYCDISKLGNDTHETLEDDGERESASSKLFHTYYKIDDRRSFLENKMKYQDMMSWMSERLQFVKEILDALRALLVLKYESFEAGFPNIDTDIFGGTHETFRELLEICEKVSEGIELTPYEMIAERRPVWNGGNDKRTQQALTVPSLERDDGNESSASKASFCSLGAEAYDPLSSMNVAMKSTERSFEKRQIADEDFFTPMPMMYLTRYELQVY